MIKTSLVLGLLVLSTISCASQNKRYPSSWFKPAPESERRSWEYLPQDAKKGEVILSKRNELGVFSNLAPSPFEYDGRRYESIESLWQMMKYPDPTDNKDPRNNYDGYKYTREEVKSLTGFACKKAGDQANAVMKKHGIKWVSYKHKKFNYKDHAAGSKLHYKIMYAAIEAKVMQNPRIKKLLKRTKGLKLRPDHKQRSTVPASYKYHDILMKIRAKL